MNHTENTLEFKTSDGQRFTYHQWKPAGNPRGRVLVLHGMGGAAGEFEPLGKGLSGAGYEVLAPNLRGQGLDPEVDRRGRFLDPQVLMRDAAEFVAATDLSTSLQPRFILGESMGALLAVRLLCDDRYAELFTGAVLLCPVLELARKTPWIVRQATRIAAILMPGTVLSPGLFVHGKAETPPLTSDEAYSRYLDEAPHRVKAFTVGFLAAMGRLMESAGKAAPHLKHPLLVLAGANDAFIRTEQIQRWLDRVHTEDKTFQIFQKSLHLLLHDAETPAVIETIRQWLDARVP